MPITCHKAKNNASRWCGDILLQYADDNSATLIAVTHDHDILDRFERVIDFKDFYAHGVPQRSAGVEESA
jgi:ABC-type lipoprotein export system ATPase subunit